LPAYLAISNPDWRAVCILKHIILYNFKITIDMIDKNRVQSCYIDEWNCVCLNRLRKDVSRNKLITRSGQMSNGKTARIHSYINIL